MSLDTTSVAQRRQKLNEEAYYSVLTSFVASNQNNIPLSARLRRELNISNEQHKLWVEELRKGGGRPIAGISAAAAAGGSTRPVRTLAAKDRMQSLQQTQQSSRPKQTNKRKANDIATMEPEPSEMGEMVGYRVEYFCSVNRIWQEGIITRFRDPNICITFNIGTSAETHEWVKWEASDKLKMVMAERVDLSKFRRQM